MSIAQRKRRWLWPVSRCLGLVPVRFQQCRCPAESRGSRRVGRPGAAHVATEERCACAGVSRCGWWVRYSVCLTLALVPLAALGLALDYRNATIGRPSLRMANKADALITLCDILSVSVCSAVAIFQASVSQGAFFRLLQQLRQVDEWLSSPPPTPPRWLAAWVLALVLLVLIDATVRTELEKGLVYPVTYLPFYILYITSFVSEALFVDDAHSIYVRFCTINETLREVFRVQDYGQNDDSKHRPVLTASGNVRILSGSLCGTGISDENHAARIRQCSWSRETVKVVAMGGGAGGEGVAGGGGAGSAAARLQRLSESHALLCCAASSVSARYGVTLLCDMLCLLLHLVITAYFFIKNLLLVPAGAVTCQYLAVQALWLGAHLGRILLLLHPCSRAKAEASRTGSIITCVINSVPRTKVTHKQLRVFALQLIHQRVSFDACGLFEMDLPLFVSILGSVTTYLVVLLQLKSPPIDKQENSTQA